MTGDLDLDLAYSEMLPTRICSTSPVFTFGVVTMLKDHPLVQINQKENMIPTVLEIGSLFNHLTFFGMTIYHYYSIVG
jgi:hypothetical protein